MGALIGPTIGSAIWRATHRKNLALIDSMDREFYQRIAKNRVDATLQSPTNPVPDYYGTSLFLNKRSHIYVFPIGEKIGSLHQYRQVCFTSPRNNCLILNLYLVAQRPGKVQTKGATTREIDSQNLYLVIITPLSPCISSGRYECNRQCLNF